MHFFVLDSAQPIRQSTPNPCEIPAPLPQSQRDLFYLAVDFNRRHERKARKRSSHISRVVEGRSPNWLLMTGNWSLH